MRHHLTTLLVYVVAAWILLVVAMIWSLTRINYQITATHLRVTWCGIPIRRIRHDDIRLVSTKRVVWAEKWFNTFSPWSRWLVIHRKSGWFKHFVISPPNRFVFRSNLYRARWEFLVKTGQVVPGSGENLEKGEPGPEPPPTETEILDAGKNVSGPAPSPN